MLDKPQAYTVSAVTRMIKDSLEEQFQGIWVEGEISNYHLHTSGHRYITLKDDQAVIRVVMWRSMGAYLKFEPKDGQKVLVFGDISVYEKGGQYQLTARKLVPVGVGELELAFRQLYEKLFAEGLFDETRKRPLPVYPLKIGLVTSPTGAAIRDFIQIARRRNPSVQLVIYAAQVQGDGAERTIAEGIRYFNTRDDIDIIVACRGGGSLEDLWSFNTEVVVRAIVASNIPVVSAVGHEVDVTLSDMAADLRAPTPSAGAELTIWSRDDLRATLQSLLSTAAGSLSAMVTQARQNLVSTLRRPVFRRPLDIVEQRRFQLDGAVRVLSGAGKNNFERHRNRLSLSLSRLDALSPLKTLARGYSVTRTATESRLVKSCDDVEAGCEIETVLTDGRLISKVETKHRN
jgi:exodeoxyribonuclease VII large subunit